MTPEKERIAELEKLLDKYCNIICCLCLEHGAAGELSISNRTLQGSPPRGFEIVAEENRGRTLIRALLRR